MSAYRVTFERIGRNHDVPQLTTEAVDLDDLAEKVWEHARKFLISHDYEVDVLSEDGHAGRVQIGCGRYGTGTFEEVTA